MLLCSSKDFVLKVVMHINRFHIEWINKYIQFLAVYLSLLESSHQMPEGFCKLLVERFGKIGLIWMNISLCHCVSIQQ